MPTLSTLKPHNSGLTRLQAHSQSRSGFTLMELMVTLSVLTVLTLLAAPAIRVDGAEGDALAHRVRSAMQHAQRTALVQQHQVLVSFDTAKNRIRIVEDKNSDGQVTLGERVTYRPLEMGNSINPPPKRLNGASAGTKSIFGSQLISRDNMPSVLFRRDGSVSSDLEVYLRTIRNGKESRRAVQVGMATGRVDWFKYLGGSTWRLGGA